MTLLTGLLVVCACALLLHCAASAEDEHPLEWHDATALKIEGRAWDETEDFFDRLPARALVQVNDSIKGLAKLSAGMAIRFASNTDTLRVRWSLGEGPYVMTHMAATGTSGLDLYTKTGDGRWAYAGTGRPENNTDNEWLAFANRPKAERTFLLYLPLFNRVAALSIGTTPGSSLRIVPNSRGKTVIFYGTSIVHGGCASRPGMAYPAIIGRALDCATVNLGFSGSARMEPVICDLLAELDPAVYVIDALPNMHGEPVAEKTLNLVQTVRKRRLTTPIVLVESITHQTGRAWGNDGSHERDVNAPLQKAYEQLLGEGCPALHYLEGGSLLGADGEGTVDGVHPTDLGFSRMAAVIGPVVARAMAQARSAGAKP
jgi:hypothetical protein